MIDHITFGVTDFEQSTAFYDRAFAPLGVRRLFDVPPEHVEGVKITGYGDERPWFWIAEADATRGKLHIALAARRRAEVDAFHAAAMAVGGRDNGAPGLRPHYDPDYYGAFVLDPDGPTSKPSAARACKKRSSRRLTRGRLFYANLDLSPCPSKHRQMVSPSAMISY
jgi:catechol 2,3-dioxygenase-like lactoylglutathione lyase family enzyme